LRHVPDKKAVPFLVPITWERNGPRIRCGNERPRIEVSREKHTIQFIAHFAHTDDHTTRGQLRAISCGFISLQKPQALLLGIKIHQPLAFTMANDPKFLS
jgi:hypothetical protein